MFIKSFFISLQGSGYVSFSSPLFNSRTEADRDRREKQCKNSNHLLNHRFHSSFFSANLEICNEGAVQLLMQIFPKKRKHQAMKWKATGLWAWTAQPLSLWHTHWGDLGWQGRQPHPFGWVFHGVQSPGEVGSKSQLLPVLTGSPKLGQGPGEVAFLFRSTTPRQHHHLWGK